MVQNPQKKLLRCLETMLAPLIRFCLKYSLGLQEVVECIKVVFIREAVAEMEASGQKINISRLTAATGVHRKDTVRIYREGDVQDDSPRFITRVIGQWMGDPRFRTLGGKPRVLSYDGVGSEFYHLVGLIGLDLRPGTVLTELDRLGVVDRTARGLSLKYRAYVPKGDRAENLKILSEDMDDFISAVLENIDCEDEQLPNIHATTVYDNVSADDLPKIRQWLEKQCGALHRRAEQYISNYDLDIHPDSEKEGGQRVVIGSFTRTS